MSKVARCKVYPHEGVLWKKHSEKVIQNDVMSRSDVTDITTYIMESTCIHCDKKIYQDYIVEESWGGVYDKVYDEQE